jgi:two-component system nitrate/nitrite sensor histidine kinase NarX
LKDSSRTVGDAYLDAREAIENLRRVPAGRLDAWLAQMAEDFEALTNLPVELDVHLNLEFPLELQVQMIRIVQEALTNVRKHAQASRVWLRAREEGQEALIEVADNGLGFSSTDSITAARYGLRGMRERAESIGADFQVTSCPKGGTTVRLQVPLRVGIKP